MKTLNYYYRLENVNELFATLRDAKSYIWVNYTPNERIKHFDGTVIESVKGGNVVSVVLIDVKENGVIRYSRPVKTEELWGKDAKYRIQGNRIVKR